MFKLNGSKLTPLHEVLIQRTVRKEHLPKIMQPHSLGWSNIATKAPTDGFPHHTPHNILANTEIK